ncbi:PAS domain-containing protein [Aquimarina agarivorans]|uniref:PAS domain-containing protein n=1 Tax=Aquimarina agarivorans TaxID=980584 RepID=UPI000248FDCA|nr:PAS domain-containing protein [Aquimarina agarivorans]
MSFLDKYEDKVAEYSGEIKQNLMPLISWDIHMMNFTNQNQLNRDIIGLKKITERLKMDVDVIEELVNNKAVIVVTDANFVIEYASSNMIDMSGYLNEEVLGKTPKMFQGPKTDKVLSKKIRASVDKQERFEAMLVNYKKDKTEYNCYIKGYPIFNSKGELVKYVAVEHAA